MSTMSKEVGLAGTDGLCAIRNKLSGNMTHVLLAKSTEPHDAIKQKWLNME